MEANQTLYQEIKEIIATVSEQDLAAIDIDDNLPQKHDINSLMGLEILVSLEKKYKIRIPESRLQDMTTVRQISEIILEEQLVK